MQTAYAQTLFVNDAGYVQASGAQQVLHRDLQPRAAAGQVVLSCFVVLTPCPRDGNHGSWVVSNTFLNR